MLITNKHPEAMVTPLIESFRFRHLDIAKFLLKNGTDVYTKEDFSGDRALSATKKINKP